MCRGNRSSTTIQKKKEIKTYKKEKQPSTLKNIRHGFLLKIRFAYS